MHYRDHFGLLNEVAQNMVLVGERVRAELNPKSSPGRARNICYWQVDNSGCPACKSAYNVIAMPINRQELLGRPSESFLYPEMPLMQSLSDDNSRASSHGRWRTGSLLCCIADESSVSPGLGEASMGQRHVAWPRNAFTRRCGTRTSRHDSTPEL